MAMAIPRPLQSPFDPPTGALPPLPSPIKTRKSLPSTNFSRLPSNPNPTSRLRTPSRTGLPIPFSQTPTTPSIPTWKDTIRPTEDKTIRRSVSIAAFPQPPKPVSTRIGKLNHRPSLGPNITTSNLDIRSNSRDPTTPPTPTSADGLKTRKLRRPTKQISLNSAYSTTPSLLSSGGQNATVPANPSTEGLLNLNTNSPTQSRTSSAQGSYSTQATTFEEDELTKPRNEYSTTNEEGSDRSSQSEKEKGNVTVSVRVRPNAAARESKTDGEWMVDGRRSLVAFRGKEGGDYYYGQSRHIYISVPFTNIQS